MLAKTVASIFQVPIACVRIDWQLPKQTNLFYIEATERKKRSLEEKGGVPIISEAEAFTFALTEAFTFALK